MLPRASKLRDALQPIPVGESVYPPASHVEYWRPIVERAIARGWIRRPAAPEPSRIELPEWMRATRDFTQSLTRQ